jgi:CHAD domain-containing protein
MSENNLAEVRPARYQAVVRQGLEKLSDGGGDPATVHRTRTHLRRLQAYHELLGETRNADAIARCVARLSALRTLQVFSRYLKSNDAPGSDRKAVKRRIRAECRKLERTHAYASIERVVRRLGLPRAPANPAWLAERMRTARQTHADALRQMVSAIGSKPKRKALHRLRLLVKSIRYQEEWATGQPFATPSLVRRLKHAQAVLGDFEDLFQFRKLAAALDLQSSAMINKHWRMARTRARALPARLLERLGLISGPPVRLVVSRSPSSCAAGEPR